ncbi:MAG: hypothetical protein K6L76_04615 [Agarilytica sp.]
MNTIKGAAQNVSGAARLYRHYEAPKSQGATKLEKTSLDIDSQRIEIRSSTPPNINENDIVSVSGKIIDGIFHAYSYKNHSNGDSGNDEIVSQFILGLVDPGVA